MGWDGETVRAYCCCLVGAVAFGADALGWDITEYGTFRPFEKVVNILIVLLGPGGSKREGLIWLVLLKV